MKNRSLAREGEGERGVSGFVALFPLVSTELACSLPYLAPPRAKQGRKKQLGCSTFKYGTLCYGPNEIADPCSYGSGLVLPPHAIRRSDASAEAWQNAPYIAWSDYTSIVHSTLDLVHD